MWSIGEHIPSKNAFLVCIQYSIIISRAPRRFTYVVKLTATASQVLLLITYPLFKKHLPVIRYDYLQMLTFGITIGESRNLSSKTMNDMKILLFSFMGNFPHLECYIVQSIHKVEHFSIKVHDFSSLFNYSTFNFESFIGRITSKLHRSPKSFSCLSVGCLSAAIHSTT